MRAQLSLLNSFAESGAEMHMEKVYDIVALGEILIDFTPEGTNENNMLLYSCNPGGAPANVLTMISKLGGKTSFIGKVGKDIFGDLLIETLEKNGIDKHGLAQDDRYHTTLGFVRLSADGDRSFSFYRNPGADLMLCCEEIPNDILQQGKFFHFGSLSMTGEPGRSTTLWAVKKAKANGAIITYDPNYREPLWTSEGEAVKIILDAMPMVDILKVSAEEMELLTGEKELICGTKTLSAMGPRVVVVTLGEEGSYCYTKNCDVLTPTFPMKALDTTGAGDAFFGALLWNLKDRCLDEIVNFGKEDWEKALLFANAAGALTTQAKGAMPAMPDHDSIMNCLNGKL